MRKPAKRVNFFVYAIGLILLFAVTFVYISPDIQKWRWNLVDRLLSKAESSSEPQVRLGLLQQAMLVGYRDPQATYKLAKFWQDRGELVKAALVYESGIVNPNYSYLADLSLKAQDYSRALKYSQKANREEPTSVGLLAEANAQFNLNKISEGCDLSARALKFNLNNLQAKRALTSCKILSGNPGEGLVNIQITRAPREDAYLLINNYVFKPGEQKLLEIQDKTANDYLLLAKLSSARGDLDQALERVEQGINLDQSNIELNELAVILYGQKKDQAKAQLYSKRLDQLKFVKYQ